MKTSANTQTKQNEIRMLSLQIEMAKTYRRIAAQNMDPKDLRAQSKLVAADALIADKEILLLGLKTRLI